MNKILILICTFCILFSSSYEVYAKTSYARASQAVNLYKYSENNSTENIICLVEKSYFVEIISESNDYFRVNYNGISGYVKKNEVKEVNNTPSTPFPYNIKITLESDCNLRTTPTSKSSINNIITTLKAGESNFTFIGRIFGDEAIDFGGTTWYYVNFQGNYGYIYNKYVKSITPIYENTEVVTYKTVNSEKTVNPITHTPSLLIIVILFIPCLFILIILYVPRRRNKRIKHHKEPKVIDKY